MFNIDKNCVKLDIKFMLPLSFHCKQWNFIFSIGMPDNLQLNIHKKQIILFPIKYVAREVRHIKAEILYIHTWE